ncbi:MAG: hypothetical protein ACKN97_03800, partial [Acidobacteriota bacterium]
RARRLILDGLATFANKLVDRWHFSFVPFLKGEIRLSPASFRKIFPAVSTSKNLRRQTFLLST